MSWDGGGNGTSWNDALNWSNNQIPSSADDVTIDIAGTPTITIDSGNQSVHSLISQEALMIAGGSLTILSNSTLNAALTNSGGALTLQSTTLSGTGTITNSAGRTMTLTGATINTAVTNQGILVLPSGSSSSSINGAFANQAGARLTIAATTLTVGNGFTNDGQIELADPGITNGSNGGTLTITNGTLVNSATGSISVPSANGAGNKTIVAELDNRGTITISDPNNVTFLNKASAHHSNSGTISITNNSQLTIPQSGAGASFSNSNIIDLAGGYLQVSQSGTAPSFANSGSINVSAGQIFTIGGGTFTQNTGSLSGAGTLSFVNTAATFATSLPIALLSLSGTTITLGADLSTDATHITSTTNSTINGPVTVTNSPGQTLNLTGATVNTPLTNKGTLAASGGSSIHGTFANEVGSRLTVGTQSGGASLTIDNGFTNYGAIELADPGATGSSQVILAVTNGTLVNAPTGTITTPATNGVGNKTIAAEVNNQGTITISDPNYALYFSKPSAHHQNSGTINLSGDWLTINQTGTAPSFTNAGTINVTANQVLAVQGGTFTQNTGSLGGAGTLSFAASNISATASFATPLPISFLSLASTTLNLAADLSTDTTHITLATNSTINGSVTLTNSPGQTLNLNGTTVNTALTNQGTIAAIGTSTINGSFTDQVGSRLNVGSQGVATNLTIANGFTNYGAIELANVGSTGTNFGVTLAVTNGTLTNSPAGTITVPAVNGTGSKTIRAELNNQGTVTLADATVVNSMFLDKASAHHTNSGTINITGTSANFFQSGTAPSFTNTGTINIAPNSNLGVTTGTFTNQGTLNALGSFVSSATNNFNSSGFLTGAPSGTSTITGSVLGNTTNANLFAPQQIVQLGFSGTTRQFEAMSQDRGAIQSGFNQNFAYGRIELTSGANISLVDQSDNYSGAGAEAVYVEELVVPSGTTLNLNGLHLYARTAQLSGTILNGSVSFVADGGPLAFGKFVSGKINSVGETDEWTFYGRAGRSPTVVLDPGTTTSPAALSPAINFGRVQIIAPDNTVLGTVDSVTSGAQIVLQNVTLPTDGTYRVRVSAPPTQSSSVGDYALTLVDSTLVTSPLVFGQRYTGTANTIYDTDQWRFTAAAGQQIQFKLLNVSNSTFRFKLTGPGGFTAFTNLSGDSSLITLPTSGAYVLTATIPNGFAGDFAFRLDETSQTALPLASPYNGAIAGSGQARIFKTTTADLTQLLYTLDDSSNSDKNELYVKRGAPPTRSDYQYRFTTTSSADQRLLVPNAVAGDWYVLLYTESAAAASSYTLSVVNGGLAVDTTTPILHGDSEDTVFTIKGSGFNSQTTIRLISANNTEYLANSVDVSLPTQLTATFSAHSVPPGVYSIKVEKPGNLPVIVSDAFTMVAGGTPKLETRIILPDKLGRHVASTLYVEYENSGNAPMPAPILTVHGSDRALLTLDQANVTAGFWTSALPKGYSDTVQFIASGNTPGLLQPGEKIEIPIYYGGLQQPWTNSQGDPIDFTLTPTTVANTTLIDWESLKPEIRPSDIPIEAWDAVWANVAANTGNTWGDYVRMLDDNEGYLASLGLNVTNITDLLNFEIRQAAGLPVLPKLGSTTDLALPVPGNLSLNFGRTFLSTLSGRYQQSSLGRGWVNDWQMALQAQPDGTVIITNSDGSQRIYQPDSRYVGSYFSAAGDSSTLARLSDGSYQRVSLGGEITHFSADGKVDYVRDSIGNQITVGYVNGKLSSLTHSSGASITITYNSAGLIDIVSDSAGRQVHYTYDAGNQHLISVLGYDGQLTQYTYDTSSNPLTAHTLSSITDESNRHRYFTYDAEGRLASTSLDGNAQHVDITYDSAGKVTIDNGVGAAKLWFDNRNWIVKTEDPLGITAYATFCDCGHATSISDGVGHSLTFTLSNGLTTSATDALGNTTNYIYGDLARLTFATDPKGNKTSFTYDSKGDLLSATYADGSSEKYSYDSAGNVTSYTDRRGQTVTYAFNALGLMTSKTLPGGVATTYDYDSRGNLISTTDSTGTTTYQHDTADRLIQVTYPNGKFLHYTYDFAGRRTQIIDQDGTATNYSYNAAGELEFVRDTSNSLLAQYTYDPTGRVIRKDLGNGTYTTYAYDAASNVLQVANHAAGGALDSQFDYTYNLLGQRATMTTPEGAWAYTYDGAGQLIRAIFTSNNPASQPNQDLQYIYDANGNRVQTITNGTTTNYTANNLNEYTAAAGAVNTYDRDGNLISSTLSGQTTLYTYDAQNRLVGVTSPTDSWTYEYDALGNRKATIHNGQRTDYLIDPTGFGNVMAEYDNSGSPAAQYTFGLGLTSQTRGGSTSYYDIDAIGSIVGLTGNAGTQVNQYRYDPFGNMQISIESATNRFKYDGALGVSAEGTGLLFMRARSYNPQTGAFTTVDPVGHAGANFYSYASNEPLSLTDPSGLRVTPTVVSALCGCALQAVESATGVFDKGPAWVPPIIDGAWGATCGAVGGAIEGGVPGAIIEGTIGGISGALGREGGPGDVCGGGNDNPNPPGPGGSGGSAAPGDGGGGSGSSSATATSVDPNDKIGPSGFGLDHYINDSDRLSYKIDFENDAAATAPAQEVLVSDQLSSNFDWDSFELGTISFGDTVIEVPAGTRHYQTTVSMTYNGKTFNVEIEIGIHSDTGEVNAVFESIDPNNNGLPPDVLTGFLPPEDGTGRGQGYFTYTIKTKSGLATGTAIRNIATVQFDRGEIIATNQVQPHDPSAGTDPTKEALVTIDRGAPTSSVTSLSATNYPNFVVNWTGTDDAGGSGIGSYDVFVSDNGGAFSLWQDGNIQGSAIYSGQVGHTYAFYSVATDNVGNAEVASGNAQATTTTVAPPLPDYNANHSVDGADYVFWRKTNSASVTPLYSGADGSGNGVVDQQDYSEWSQHFGESTAAGDSLQSGEAPVAGSQNPSAAVSKPDDALSPRPSVSMTPRGSLRIRAIDSVFAASVPSSVQRRTAPSNGAVLSSLAPIDALLEVLDMHTTRGGTEVRASEARHEIESPATYDDDLSGLADDILDSILV